jgi:hypothetical protein
MRWPRPRFTVRGLMIAIAILAIRFGAISLVARTRDRSSAYRRRATEFLMSTLRTCMLVRTADGRWVDPYETENDWLRDAWAWRIEAKYLRLSYYPWLTAEPDPPPPQPLAHPRRAGPARAGRFASSSGTCPAPAGLDVPVDLALATAGIGTVGVSRPAPGLALRVGATMLLFRVSPRQQFEGEIGVSSISPAKIELTPIDFPGEN